MGVPVVNKRLVGTVASINVDVEEQRTELDNHADTCVVSEDTSLIIHDYERPVQVFGYNESVGTEADCKTVSAVVAYDHPVTGEVYMIVIHQAILIPEMKVNLLGTMQVRDNDVKVNDEPKSMVANPTEDHHCIVFPQLDNNFEPLRIPLQIHKVNSYFPSRKPTRQEYEESELQLRLDLTAESPQWDPTATRFQEQEASMLGSGGQLLEQRLGAMPSQLWQHSTLYHYINLLTTNLVKPW